MNGVKIEAGRHLEGHSGNLRDNNRLNQVEPCFLSRKRGVSSVWILYVS